MEPGKITTMVNPLSDKWTLWSHLPHNSDWSMASYIPIITLSSVEEAIAVMEILPNTLIENCMLFLMRQGIKPMWEDPKNRNGGFFSYKISNSQVCKVWRNLSYVTLGGTISKNATFVEGVNGITISPKKNFCILKIWMKNCLHQNPELITTELAELPSQGCIFKKQTPEF